MPSREWLPALVCLDQHGGDWDTYIDAVYAVFRRDFVDSRPKFRGVALGLKRLPLTDGREATFWHMASEGEKEDERIPELRRCERIGWPRPTIEHEADPEIKVWEEHRRGNEYRVHIWLEADDYVVVLARRRAGQPDEYVLPWTAFVVESGHYRRGLQKRFEKYRQKD